MNFTIPFTDREILVVALNILRALVIVLVALLVSRSIRGYLLRIGTRRRMNVNAIALISNLIRVGLIVLAVVLILPSFGVDWTTLATVAGAVGLAVSLAFQDLLRNFIAGIYILVERPFTLGDKVTLQSNPEITGTVQSIELRITTIRSEDGLLVVVPNNTIFSTPLTNRSAINLQRDVIRVALNSSDLEAVSSGINNTLATFSQVSGSPAPSIIVDEATPSSLQLRVEYWTPPAYEATLAPQIVLALRKAFPTADITVIR
jgi:small conductance mechanosensitive channel